MRINSDSSAIGLSVFRRVLAVFFFSISLRSAVALRSNTIFTCRASIINSLHSGSSCYSTLFIRRTLPVFRSQNERHIQYSLSDLVRVDDFLRDTSGVQIAGVYMIVDKKGQFQYIGRSDSSIASDVMGHRAKYGVETVDSLRVQTFSSTSKAALDAYRKELISQLSPIVPIGNRAYSDGGWERDLFIEVGDVSDAVVQESLKPDVDSDQEKSRGAPVTAVSPQPEVESPFSLKVAPISEVDGEGALELTIDNVNRVLDEVRPYLIADGGNVAVKGIDATTRDVILTLQGACGSCPSSTTTMKMGIERVLRENFVNLGAVIAAQPDVELPSELTVEIVEQSMGKVLPAVKSLGGSVDILSVDSTSGSVVLRYKGPPKLAQGLIVILKENSMIKEVIIENS